MIGFVFRFVFSLGILIWYSISVWNMIADYFNKEFQKLLENTTKEIENVLHDEL